MDFLHNPNALVIYNLILFKHLDNLGLLQWKLRKCLELSFQIGVVL